VVYGRANNEQIVVDSALTLPAFLFAGDGTNALIDGGGGPTVEVGGAGGAVLKGGTGRNILIAGRGGAHLEGGKADDILIGGYTDFDNNLAALQAILAEWNSSDSNAVRTAALSSYFNATTVHDDGIADRIDSGSGQDWVFALLSGRQKDQLKGFNPNDTVVGIQ
jgi:Ca2+-binding RTX toxin-like protein